MTTGRVRHRRAREERLRRRDRRRGRTSCARTPRRPRRSASWTRRSSARRSASSSSTARTTSSRIRSTSTATRSTACRRTRSSSVRELNVDQLGAAASWQNTTLVYTHGYGLVAAKGNDRTTDGNPGLPRARHPGRRASSPTRRTSSRACTSASTRRPTRSSARPRAPTRSSSTTRRAPTARPRRKTTFEGDGGPSIGSVFNRLIYALKFQSEQILFSDYVNEDSQILYDRDPSVRVQKAAPYLELDSDPYPSVVDGRIVWIIDGYTLSANYPYSTTVSLQQAITDANNTAPRFALDDINYIRNSVKATVDAYDGSVTLYAWDEEDPVLQAWQKVYPSTLKPISRDVRRADEPRALPDRPVQGAAGAARRVPRRRRAVVLPARQRLGRRPNDPQTDTALQPPYYLTMQMPGQEAPTYSMFTSFIPSSEGDNSRNVLMGYLAVDSNAGSEAGVKSHDYGKLRMLVIDADTTIPGPGQVQNTFNSDPRDLVSDQHPETGPVRGAQRQPADAAGRRRSAVRAAGVRAGIQRHPAAGAAEGAGRVRRRSRVRGHPRSRRSTCSSAATRVPTRGDADVDADARADAHPDADAEPTPEPTDPAEPPADEYQAALQEAQQAMLDRDAALQAGDLDRVRRGRRAAHRRGRAAHRARRPVAVRHPVVGDEGPACDHAASGGEQPVPDQQERHARSRRAGSPTGTAASPSWPRSAVSSVTRRNGHTVARYGTASSAASGPGQGVTSITSPAAA